MEVINILSVLFSPIIAVLITIYLQNRSEKRKHKMELFRTLLLTKNINFPMDKNAVSMYNMINIYFYRNKKIRQIWKECFDLLCTNGYSVKLVEEKKAELLFEIAKDLGYGKAINHLDFDRIYYPKGVADQDEIERQISTELLRVLKNSDAIITIVNEGNRGVNQ